MTSAVLASSTRRRARWRRGLWFWSACSTPRRRAGARAWGTDMWSGSRYRLYRDTEHGLLAGVCAGIADYVGIERIVIRLAFVVTLVFFIVPAALTYILLVIALPKRPPALAMTVDETAV